MLNRFSYLATCICQVFQKIDLFLEIPLFCHSATKQRVIIFRSCCNDNDAWRQLFHNMSFTEIRSLIFSGRWKQPSIPRECVLIMSHFAGWEAEAQKC